MRNRAWRSHQTERIIKKRSKQATWSDYVHRYGKTSPYDCGNARCWTCHSEKLGKKYHRRNPKFEYNLQEMELENVPEN